jgi:lysyl-tRNA synthetase class 1
MDETRDAALEARAWPFEEARRLIRRYETAPPAKGHVLFETGYGPSGLPHIGTFGEVARTTMVRRAFETMSDIPTRLICFSDDMDGLRKVPGNVPMQDELQADLNLPLTKVRDPFGTHPSFAAHNNARLRSFLDAFGFDYEFISATEYYREGRFDAMLLRVLERFDAVMEIMLPSLGADRQATYSPFMPVSPKTGHVLQVPTLERHVAKGTIVYAEPDGERVEVPVTGGNVKLQWKPDWAMRWAALGVDYEMFGKDLIPSAELGARICRALDCPPPELFNYEHFNDEMGQKISKSKGNGLSMEEWLTYASPESLGFFMYQ